MVGVASSDESAPTKEIISEVCGMTDLIARMDHDRITHFLI